MQSPEWLHVEAVCIMIRVNTLALTSLVWLSLIAAQAGPAAAQRVVTTNAPHFYVAFFQVPAGVQTVLTTAGCIPPADPVFHLLNTGYVQLAYDDNSGGGVNSRIVIAPTPTPAQYVLLMRAQSNTTFGTCDVVMNGSVLNAGVPVGGWRVAASQVTFAGGDRLHTQHVPGGSTMPSLVKFNPSRTTVTGMALGNFIGGSSRLTLSGLETDFLVGTPVVSVNGAPPTAPRGGGRGFSRTTI